MALGCHAPPSGADGGGGAGGAGGAGGNDLGGGKPGARCTPPIGAADVSHPSHVVGSGSAASCTAPALAAAVQQGGVITFDCGGDVTIALDAELALSTTSDTVLDGGGHVTLDGGGETRLLRFASANFRATRTTVTLQHLTLQNGKAAGTPIPSAPAPCSQGFQGDGGGGAVYVRDGVLHVVDVTFAGNAAASPGPDVAGGARQRRRAVPHAGRQPRPHRLRPLQLRRQQRCQRRRRALPAPQRRHRQRQQLRQQSRAQRRRPAGRRRHARLHQRHLRRQRRHPWHRRRALDLRQRRDPHQRHLRQQSGAGR